jgi:hypothetical protein
MKPPRVPLHAVNRENLALNMSNGVQGLKQAEGDGKTSGAVAVTVNGTVTGTTTTTTTASTKPERFVSDTNLAPFKAAVKGSDETQIGIIESLKKQYVFDRNSRYETERETQRGIYADKFSHLQIPNRAKGCYQEYPQANSETDWQRQNRYVDLA